MGLPLFHQVQMLQNIHLHVSYTKTWVLETISRDHKPIPILAFEITIKFSFQII